MMAIILIGVVEIGRYNSAAGYVYVTGWKGGDDSSRRVQPTRSQNRMGIARSFLIQRIVVRAVIGVGAPMTVRSFILTLIARARVFWKVAFHLPSGRLSSHDVH